MEIGNLIQVDLPLIAFWKSHHYPLSTIYKWLYLIMFSPILPTSLYKTKKEMICLV